MNIYELTEQYRALEYALAQNPEDEELAVLFEGIQDSLRDKADGYARIIRNFEADVKALKEEEDRLASRRRSTENTIRRLKENLLQSMKQTGETKFKTDLFSFSVAKNGGAAPLVIDAEVAQIPQEFRIVTETADKEAIRKYIEETGDVSFAHIEDRGEHVSIR